MDEVVHTFTELTNATTLGRSLEQPSGHFIRLLRLLSTNQRRDLIADGQKLYESIYIGNYTQQQFVAHALFCNPAAEDDLGTVVEDDSFLAIRGQCHLQVDYPQDVVVESLDAGQQNIVAAACKGEDIGALARILGRTVVTEFEFGNDLLDLFARTLGRQVLSPDLAAGLHQCLNYNARLTASFRTDARELIDYASTISKDRFLSRREIDADDGLAGDDWDQIQRGNLLEGENDRSSEHNRARFMHVVESVEQLVTSSSLTTLDEVNGALRMKLDFPSKFRFLESPYGVIVPVRECQRISQDFTGLIERVSANKADLLQLSPRQFEVFIGDLFRGLGYSVELTKATRDGGADLLCLKNENGIPFRLAVEVKRYKEGRPITVGMVRSFVGANEQFHANRLVYVTTSSYTSSAQVFADRYASHHLSLKNFDQIQEWCRTVGKENWKLIS